MPTPLEEVKRQKNLIVFPLIFFLITILILYFGYFKKKVSPLIEVFVPQKKIEIDFSIFENPILKELQPPEKIAPAGPEEIGRENPFLPIK
jgi:hypothetical protein